MYRQVLCFELVTFNNLLGILKSFIFLCLILETIFKFGMTRQYKDANINKVSMVTWLMF